MKRLIKLCNYILRRLTKFKEYPTLPEIFFLIGTYFFPQVNVELIIIVDHKLLLSWRDDHFGNIGWHLPGGIIRPNETILNRINEVLKYEAQILDSRKYTIKHLEMREVFSKNRPAIRSHFISLIYLIKFQEKSDVSDNRVESGLKYFDYIPHDLIENHKVYHELLQSCMIKPYS